MMGKETEAFFDGKMRRNMELREDTCTLSSNNTYRSYLTTDGKIRISGDLGIPDFTSRFQFKDGMFSVADSGFAVDMGALDGRVIPRSSGNMYSDM